jgi:hypothetical protein
MPSAEDYVYHWLEQSLGQAAGEDPFLRFMTVWVGFNAMYAQESSAIDGDRNQVRAIAKKENMRDMHHMLLQHPELPEYRIAIEMLAGRGVRNLQKDYTVSIEQSFPLEDVLECVYQVRCNCFHGGKHKLDSRDRDLVTASFVIIANLLSYYMTGKIAGSWEKILEHYWQVEDRRYREIRSQVLREVAEKKATQ